MSFELYLLPFHNGRPGALSRAELAGIFPIVATQSTPDHWTVRYDGGQTCTIGLTPAPGSPDMVESLCVYRPCHVPRLWEDVHAVLRLGPVALLFPGTSPPVVASAAAAAHLPGDVIYSMGAPTVVRSGLEIAEILARS